MERQGKRFAKAVVQMSQLSHGTILSYFHKATEYLWFGRKEKLLKGISTERLWFSASRESFNHGQDKQYMRLK